MLTHLYLQNFAIVDELSLDFQPGMSALTGETGAGKSILLGAIGLALGARAEAGMVRHGAQRAEITISFDITQLAGAKKWLDKNALLQGDECLIRRSISKDGRSKAFINAVPTTQQALRELGSLLINLHGQHDHQLLLNSKTQQYFLDAFAKNQPILKTLRPLFQQWQAAKVDLATRKQQASSAREQSAFLAFQMEELARLNVSEESLLALEQEHKQLANADQLIQSGRDITQWLGEDQGAISAINKSLQQLSAAKDQPAVYKNAQEALSGALVGAEEALSEVEHFLNDFDSDPARLGEIEQQLSAIHTLARKHQVLPQALPGLLEQWQKEHDELSSSDEKIQQLEQTVSELSVQYNALAAQLSQRRQKSAVTFGRQISQCLKQLGMPQAIFEVRFSPCETPTRDGLEKAHFVVNLNPGHGEKILAKVASGGELSRISLAIHLQMAKILQVPTLVFDEVDTGIGGKTADIVGSLLKKLGTSAQVLCITHLPQVASKAQHHLRVEKSMKKNPVTATVVTLDAEQRILEIARMSGGAKITEVTKAHAKAMLSE
jgi:DNA repair protein RecN (Recombination protein N)